MTAIPSRRAVIHYGTQPLHTLTSPYQSVQACTGGDISIDKQHLTASVGEICRTDHTVALHSAKLHGLEVCDKENLLSD